MSKVYQPVTHEQGNRMMDPGTSRRGPVFKTYYQANRWGKENWSTINYWTVESITVFERWQDA